MATIQEVLQTIWASIVDLGLIKTVIVVIIIGVLTRFNKLLGLLATILFIAYLVHWI